MKKFALVFMFAGLLISCDSDDDVIDDGGFEGETVEYAINPYGDSEVEGMITFTENEDGSITADIELENTVEGTMHPAHIHAGNGTEDGDIVLTFDEVDGDEGTSSTTFSTWDDDSDVTWDELIEYDGYVNVHLSDEDLSIVAQGDIGENELTGETVSYNLDEISESGVSGEAIFEERVNGETLVTLKLEGTSEEGEHPAHIHAGSVGDNGTIVISLNSVGGESGWSQTNISHYDDAEEEEGEAVSYEELIEIDGYINIHESAENLEVVIAQGNVGENVE